MTNQEAIENLRGILTEATEYENAVCYVTGEDREPLEMAIEALENQKTGHWIKYGCPRCGEQHYKCTSCGYYINFGQWGEFYTKEFKYCPNCCAKMEGE